MSSNSLSPSFETAHKAVSLHSYLQSSCVDPASRLFSDLIHNTGIGRDLPEGDNILYYYNGNTEFHVFSKGGRLFYFANRSALSFSSGRLKALSSRFITVSEAESPHMAQHFENLINLSQIDVRTKIHPSFRSGKYIVHMHDLCTPYIELREVNDQPLVLPQYFVTDLAAVNVIPMAELTYMKQCIIMAASDDLTVRVMYVCHRLSDKLFKGSIGNVQVSKKDTTKRRT